jgi:hypothetical protein
LLCPPEFEEARNCDRLHRQAEPIPWNKFPGFLNIYKYRFCMLNTVAFLTYYIYTFIAWKKKCHPSIMVWERYISKCGHAHKQK